MTERAEALTEAERDDLLAALARAWDEGFDDASRDAAAGRLGAYHPNPYRPAPDASGDAGEGGGS